MHQSQVDLRLYRTPVQSRFVPDRGLNSVSYIHLPSKREVAQLGRLLVFQVGWRPYSAGLIRPSRIAHRVSSATVRAPSRLIRRLR